jgi:hypothetical protein
MRQSTSGSAIQSIFDFPTNDFIFFFSKVTLNQRLIADVIPSMLDDKKSDYIIVAIIIMILINNFIFHQLIIIIIITIIFNIIIIMDIVIILTLQALYFLFIFFEIKLQFIVTLSGVFLPMEV